MKVEIWSDVVCPWCYIGKRRFESALAQYTGDEPIEVTYHAYQLDPTAPPGVSTPVSEVYARKFGGTERAEAIIANVTAVAADVGLEFRLDRAQRANTLLAHRLIWFAGTQGLQAEMKERLLAAYFTDGLAVGDPDVLTACAGEVGVAGATEFLAGEAGSDEVAEDLAQAVAQGITAVPTYVIDGRWAIPGAQEPDTFLRVIERMAARRADPSPQ